MRSALDGGEPAATGTDVGAEEFRAACSQFPTGVVVVTTSTPVGDYGGTVSSFTSLSLDPPRVIVCLARSSTTWSAIRRARAFTVNVLAADQVVLARLFASKSPDKLSGVRYHSGAVGAPVLEGALSAFECRLDDAIPKATHMMLVGEVEQVRHDSSKEPALYFRSRMYEGFRDAVPLVGSTARTIAGTREPRAQWE